MNLFTRAWKGQASLAAAFWLIHVLFGIILAIVVAIIMSFFVVDFFRPEVYPLYTYLMMAIVFPYTLFSAICVWRCGKNSSMIWSVLARILVVLSVISGVISVLRVAHIM